MKEPLVSVCMITYNHEPYIAQAIEGVVQQTNNFPFELVIGEDCSTDGTRKIVFEYQKKYPDIIRVITSNNNVGMHKNGLRTEDACQGKYIAYCEGDDYWQDPQKLHIQLNHLEVHPDCGLVHSDINTLDGESMNLTISVNKYAGISMDDTIDHYMGILEGTYPVYTCTVCVRRSSLDEAKKNIIELIESNQYVQADLPRWLAISRIAKVKYFDRPFSVYRILEESAMHSKKPLKVMKAKLSSFGIRKYFIDKYGCSTIVRNKILKKYYDLSLNYGFYAKDYEIMNQAKRQLVSINSKLSISQFVKYCSVQNNICYYLLRIIITLYRQLYNLILRPRKII